MIFTSNNYNLFSQAPAPIAVCKGKELRFEFVNEACSKIFNGRQVIGKTVREAFPELEGQGYYEILEEVYNTGIPFYARETPARIDLAADGNLTTVYYNLVYTPYKNDNGTIEGVMAFGYDVTELVEARKRAEDVVEKSNFRNALYEAQNESTSDGVLIADAKGKILLYNKRFVEIWKMPQEVIDSRDDDAALKHAKTQLVNPEAFISRVHNLYTQNDEKNSEQLEFKDGRVIARTGSPVIGENNFYYGWAWYFRDITEEVLAVKKIQVIKDELERTNGLINTITDNATSTLFMMNAKGYCTYMNAAGEKMFGYSQQEIRQKQLHYLIHHHKADGTFYPLEDCPLDRALPENFDVRAHRDLFFRKDGSSFPVSCAASPIFEEGIPVSTVIEVRDISREIEAEETLRRSAEELERMVHERTLELKEANEQLQQFTYAASHDLQEPLRKISFFLERLSSNINGSLDEQNKKFIEKIRATTARMRGLIEDLLHYSNTTLGATAFEDINLNTLVEEVLSDLEGTIIEKDAIVEVEKLPKVKGDKRQLRQLIHNLISNALKYHKAGERPKVYVNYQISKDENGNSIFPHEFKNGEYYKIEVRDNGIGFNQKDAEKIFTIFQRLHGKHEYEGTGIGLAIARKVVENHRGFIGAESQPGEGTVFKVLLPAE